MEIVMNTSPTSATYEGQLAGRVAELLGDVDLDARLELLGAMDPADMRTSLAWLAAFAPQMFDFALVRDAALVDRLNERLDEEAKHEPQPFCAACGATVGIFHGHGPDWRHYRGEGTVASPVELLDAGHAPVVAWREGAVGSIEGPAVPTLTRVRCQRTVWTDGNPESCGLPVDHEPDEKCVGNPHARPAAGTSSQGGAQ
jgi:hypothetical protein